MASRIWEASPDPCGMTGVGARMLFDERRSALCRREKDKYC